MPVRERHPETGNAVVKEPSTSALLASVDLSTGLSVRPENKLKSDLQDVLGEARSQSTERWVDPSNEGVFGCDQDDGSSDGDSGSDGGGDTGASGSGDSGYSGGGYDSGVEKSCGDGCGSGNGCTDSGDTAAYSSYSVDSGMVLPGVVGLLALARRRRRV